MTRGESSRIGLIDYHVVVGRLRTIGRGAAIIATLGVGVVGGDLLVGGPISNWLPSGLDRWDEEYQRQWELVEASIDPTLQARIDVLTKDSDSVPVMSGSLVDLLCDIRDLKEALGMRHRRGWQGFTMSHDERQFRAVEPLGWNDLPEPARELIDRIGAWHESNPEAVWGRLPEDAPGGVPPGFWRDQHQFALVEVIPDDHPYWLTMSRVFLMGEQYASLGWFGWEDQSVILTWILQSGETGRDLVKVYSANIDERRRISQMECVWNFWMTIGPDYTSDVDGEMIVLTPQTSVQERERMIAAIEQLGNGCAPGQSWLDSSRGVLASLEPKLDYRFFVGNYCLVIGGAEQAARLWQWAQGTLPADEVLLDRDDEQLFGEIKEATGWRGWD